MIVRPTRFTGAVLTGGSSSRMGRDKAALEVAGRPLARIAADALRAAGASRVFAVGGDAGALGATLDGIELVPDRHPGEGPLGGIVTALGAARDEIVAVVACDMPAIDGPTVEAIVAALAGDPEAALAAPRLGDRLQILTAAYRRAARAHLERAFDAGERAPRRAVEGLRVAEVGGLDPVRLGDVDRPEDLSRYAQPDLPGT